MAEFPKRRLAPKHIDEKSSFTEWFFWYLDARGLSENGLAVLARIDQSELNKIVNIHSAKARKNVPVYQLVKICLALGLTENQAVDLMARRERALSPADTLHDLYRQLIRRYAVNAQTKDLQDVFKSQPEHYLDFAYEFLQANYSGSDRPEIRKFSDYIL